MKERLHRFFVVGLLCASLLGLAVLLSSLNPNNTNHLRAPVTSNASEVLSDLKLHSAFIRKLSQSEIPPQCEMRYQLVLKDENSVFFFNEGDVEWIQKAVGKPIRIMGGMIKHPRVETCSAQFGVTEVHYGDHHFQFPVSEHYFQDSKKALAIESKHNTETRD